MFELTGYQEVDVLGRDLIEALGLSGFDPDRNPAQLVGRIGSISFIAAAGEEPRAAVDQRLRAMAAERGGRVDLRYVTSAYVSRAV